MSVPYHAVHDVLLDHDRWQPVAGQELVTGGPAPGVMVQQPFDNVSLLGPGVTVPVIG